MSTRRIAIFPGALQCVACGSSLYMPLARATELTTHVTAECFRCNVTLRVPLTIIDCEVVEENPHGTQKAAAGDPAVNGTAAS